MTTCQAYAILTILGKVAEGTVIYFIHEFDRRLDVSHAQMVKSYAQMAEGWQKAWPSNRLIGFFSRRYSLGAGTEYMAVWEMPNFAAFDEWQGTWQQVKGVMQPAEEGFHGAVLNERSRVMEKLLP